MLDVVLTNLNNYARIIACGMISQYNTTSHGVKNLMEIVAKRLLFQGFIMFDHYEKKYYDPFQKDVSQWIKDGKLIYKERKFS